MYVIRDVILTFLCLQFDVYNFISDRIGKIYFIATYIVRCNNVFCEKVLSFDNNMTKFILIKSDKSMQMTIKKKILFYIF